MIFLIKIKYEVVPMNSNDRNQIIQEIISLLATEGFQTSNVYEQSCFDMFARKKLLLLLLKVLVNIDSIYESHIQEIRKISSTFLASPLIVGFKSKNKKLEDDVVYERHGIPAIGVETLKNMVYYDEYPEILADRGGYYVKINGAILKEYRAEYSLSLKDLANLAHVSRETIYKYENNMARANPETAMILEEILNMKVTLDINLFESKKFDVDDNNPYFNSNEDDKTKDLANLGFGVISTNKTPFDALAKLENNEDNDKNQKMETSFIANLEKNRPSKTLEKMAVSLKDLSLITSSESFFIINNKKFKKSLNGVPIINSWEIKEFGDSEEFLKVINERRDN
jgi:putative transcriptional regulator